MESQNKTARDFLIITGATLLLSILIWLPHYFQLKLFNLDFSNGINTIYRNYDGVEYITIAKSFYNKTVISGLPFSFPANYYASHFPGYSIFILILSPLLGFLKSMLAVSIIFTILSSFAFYMLVKNLGLAKNSLYLSLLFLVLPARWLVVHSVGSAEPIFIFFTIASLLLFMRYEKEKSSLLIWGSAVAAAMAQLSRPPGLLLFLSLSLFIHIKLFKALKISGIKKAILDHLNYYPLLLVPLTLLGIFLLYSINLGDFWGYFHSGDNIHLGLPYQVFNKAAPWVGEIWLEDVIYVFLLGFLGGFYLIKQKLFILGTFVLVYLLATICVAHRDIARYSLPIFPFLLIAFEKVLSSREFKIALLIILPAIYLYAQNFILGNTAPIPNLNLLN